MRTQFTLPRLLGFAFFISLSVLSLPFTLRGQNATGSLLGEVQDASGARVKSANVTATDNGSGVARQATTSSRGEFRFPDLMPGSYHVVVNAKGFADASADITVQVSTVRDVLVTLRPAAVQETVNVKGQPSSITSQELDTTNAVNGGVVTEKDLQDIPLAARSFANIAYMVAGTEPVEPSDPTKARITAVSTGGSSGLNNQLTVDGADNSDDYIGGFLQNFSPDVIREFAVQTSQSNADVGRTTAAAVVISTRSGTNNWHGDFAVFERAAALNARFPIENPSPEPKQPFSRQNYVGTIGGPIVKDKLWIFTGFEMVNEHASVNYSPDSLTQFNALSQLAQEGLIPNTTFYRRASVRPRALSVLLGHDALRLGAIAAVAVVRALRPRQFHHQQRPCPASYPALHRCDNAFQLSKRCYQQHLYLHSVVGGKFHLRHQLPSRHRSTERLPWVCAGVSVQLYLKDHLGLRDLRRQSVRHSYYCVSRDPQSGEIPVSIRC